MVRRISNSEVNTWNLCQAQYRYAFDMAIAPKQYVNALSIGILFHDAIAAYYTTLGSGGNSAQALAQANMVVQRNITGGEHAIDVCAKVSKMLAAYSSYYGTEPKWKVLEVEKSYDLPMNEEYTMPMRLDLLVQDRETGEALLVDTKTCYNFFSDSKIALYGQIPKYVGALRYNGWKIDGMMLNMVRTREIKNPSPTDMYRRQKVMPSQAKIRTVLREHILACEDITAYRAKPDEVRPIVARRVLTDFVCQYCPFKDLCMSEIDGGNIEHIIKTDYRSNPYNYNVPTNEMELL